MLSIDLPDLIILYRRTHGHRPFFRPHDLRLHHRCQKVGRLNVADLSQDRAIARLSEVDVIDGPEHFVLAQIEKPGCSG